MKVSLKTTAKIVASAREIGLCGVGSLRKVREGVVTGRARDQVDGYEYVIRAVNGEVVSIVPSRKEEIIYSRYKLSEEGTEYISDALAPYRDDFPRTSVLFAVNAGADTLPAISEYLDTPISDLSDAVLDLVAEGLLDAFPLPI